MATKKATRREQVTSNRPRPQKNIWSGYNAKRYEGLSTEEKMRILLESDRQESLKKKMKPY